MTLPTDAIAPGSGSRWPRPSTIVATCMVVAVLIALGTRQVRRLVWKADLIATLEVRRQAPPVALAVVLADPAAYEFRRVVVAGTFATDGDFYLANRIRNSRVGQHVVTPLRRADDGGVVLIDRGWVPTGWRGAAPVGEQLVEGFVRLFPTPGRFTPDNNVAGNVWYYLAPRQMAAAAGVERVAPVYLMAVPGAGPDALPAGQRPGINLRNSHLGYAITWYGLAAALVGVLVAYHLRGRPQP